MFDNLFEKVKGFFTTNTNEQPNINQESQNNSATQDNTDSLESEQYTESVQNNEKPTNDVEKSENENQQGGKTRKNKNTRKKTKKIRGGEVDSLLDYLKNDKYDKENMSTEDQRNHFKDIAKKLVESNYKGLFKDGGEIKKPNELQITWIYKDKEEPEEPPRKGIKNYCFRFYAPGNLGIVCHSMENKKCTGRGYDRYFYFDKDYAEMQEDFFIEDIEYLELVDRIKEREKSLLKNVGDTKELPSGVISDMSEYIGGNRKTKKNKKNTSRKKVNKKSKK